MAVDFTKPPWDKVSEDLKIELAENLSREDFNEIEWAYAQRKIRKELLPSCRQGYRSDLHRSKKTEKVKSHKNRHGINGTIAIALGVSHETVRKREKVLQLVEHFPRYDKERRLLEAKQISISRVYNNIKRDLKKRKIISTAPKIEFPSEQFLLMPLDFTSQRALTIVPPESLDLIVTDPPYDHASLPLYAELVHFAARSLKEGGCIVTYIGQYYMPEIVDIFKREKSLKYFWMYALINSGRNARIYQKRIFTGYKPILIYCKGNKRNCDQWFSDTKKDGKAPDKVLHRWEQKTEEAEQIIRDLTFEGQSVCDPMAGTGTTAIAALRNNRKFIGFEKDKGIYKAALAKIGHLIQANK